MWFDKCDVINQASPTWYPWVPWHLEPTKYFNNIFITWKQVRHLLPRVCDWLLEIWFVRQTKILLFQWWLPPLCWFILSHRAFLKLLLLYSVLGLSSFVHFRLWCVSFYVLWQPFCIFTHHPVLEFQRFP